MNAKQLKDSILQLAVQGKLVPQVEGESAEELLRCIAREKSKLKVKSKPLKPITPEELPFDIPSNWDWARLGDVTQINPRNSVDDNIDVGFMPMPMLSGGYGNEHTFQVRKWGEIKKGFTHFANGDIVVAKITPCFENRKSAIIKDLPNGVGSGTTELNVVRVYPNTIKSLYLLYIFKTAYFIDNGVKSFTGTAGQQRIHKDYIKNLLIPVPPLEEQKRIVAKIETLLPLQKGW